jgi:fumarate hydratase class II
MHVSAAVAIKETLIPALEHLAEALEREGEQFDDVVKIGRTHLQDATPIRLGQEISGTRRRRGCRSSAPGARSRRCASCRSAGTAVGTGINSHPDYAKQAIAVIAQKTGIDFVEAANHFEAQAAKDGVVEASGQLKTIAISLSKIANDVRWLASGPAVRHRRDQHPRDPAGQQHHAGQGQPGDERDGAAGGRPGRRQRRDDRVRRLGPRQHVRAERDDAGDGVQPAAVDRAARQRLARVRRPTWRGSRPTGALRGLVEQSLAMCTSLAPLIGYDKAADVAKESFKTGKTVRQVALDRKLMSEAELAKALDARRMTQPQADMIGSGGG